ncbi:MAG: M48 family metallopeptidase [Chromatiales bacterium]|nr:M48 family metallopeptidase [Chromatiales bacterium]
MKKAIVALAAAAMLAACATSPTGRSQLMLVSEQQAISASRTAYLQTMSALSEQGKLVTDPAVLDRVHTITGRLITQAIEMRPDSADWEWSVAVIDEPQTINAWAMAGGRMAIYTGIIDRLELTDDEIAQIMGHEIAHALANHTAERMSVAMASQLGVLAVGIFSERPQVSMTAAAAAAALAVQLPNSRASEIEADVIGIELAARAGYHPEAAITLWQKMAEVGGSGPPQFLSTHPSPGNREGRLRELVPEMMLLYEAPGECAVFPLSPVRF